MRDAIPPWGELLESEEFARRMNWTERALSRALAEKRVFFVEKQGVLYFPAFLADDKYGRRQLERITRVMSDLPGGSKLQFFATPKGSLGGRTPLDALAQGDFAGVMKTAAGFAER